LRYTGKSVEGKRARQRNARLLLTAEIFGFRGSARTKDAFRAKDVPVAKTFMPPVRKFFDPKRKSFGLQTGDEGKVFNNSAHVGDDVAWQADHRTVVAIGDGCVRRVSHVESWGYIVIVEHRLPDGKFACSLYAHLAPSICVKPGDILKKGAKIGSVGRSHTWENGGYWSHLHFGIHEGPYLSSHPVGRTLDYTLSNGVEVEGVVVKRGDPFATVKVSHKGESVTFEVKQDADWICGYVSTDYWKAGKHGWRDPQKFIRARLKEAKPGEAREAEPPVKAEPVKAPKKTAA
ncbi:MAG: peptidoglycan DD-metalloendopeptidase family protein, partial [Planctomycetota bacterium]